MSRSRTQEATKTRLEYPKRFHVVMHNDDVTTMEFVVHVLRIVFLKSVEQATELMLDIHHKGEAIVGTYTYDTAMSKASKAMQMADEEGFPLRISLQPEEKTDLPF